MTKKTRPKLPPTVRQVIEKFIDELEADDRIDANALARLEDLLSNDIVPKPDEINAALFPEDTAE